MDDRSPQPSSGPSTGTTDQDAKDQPVADLESSSEVASPSDADPRALAAASQPPNASDLISEYTAAERGVDGKGTTPWGDIPLRGGTLKLPGAANPLTGQRGGPSDLAGGAANGAANAALNGAANAAANGNAGGAAKNAANGGGAKGAQSADSAKDAAGQKARGAVNKMGNEALKAAGQKYLGRPLTMPEGDTAGEKAAHAAGQGADVAAKLLADRYAPGVYDAVKNSVLGRMLVDRLSKSHLGKAIPKSDQFWEGFKSGTKNNGEVTRAEKVRFFLIASLPILFPLVAILLIIALVLGVSVATVEEETQPSERSNREVAEYLPGDWLAILKSAAERASVGAEPYSVVPWTILAGIVKTQTDFGRYSPYDNIDRDPGRTSKELPSPGGGDSSGTIDVNVSNTRGAGPGPVEGVTGPGSAATVPGSGGHPAPPDGDLSHQLGWFLWALRMQESNGNYTARAGTSESNACGAYQYIKSTWNNYRGYPTACDAPPSIQDERAKRDVLEKFNRYRKWQQVAASHFYPAWANTPSKWNQCPAACSFNPTVWGYVDGVISKMQAAARAHPQTGGSTSDVEPASAPADVGEPVITPAITRERTGSTGSTGASDSSGTTGTTAPARATGATATAAVNAFPLDVDATDGGSSGRGTSGGRDAGLHADSCRVPNPDPPIGGRDRQGTGPYLLTPAAAGQMRSNGLDPHNPCSSSYFVARELVKAARKVHSDPKAPKWKPHGTKQDQANARKYWSRVIETSGIFVERTTSTDGPCTVPPPDDPDKPWSISYKIITIWRCEATRIQDLYLVTYVELDEEGKPSYTLENDRITVIRTLVEEAMSVSYGASKWKTEECDNNKDDRQGIFPMTKEEAEEAGVEDRCDVDKNIAGAAKLVLSVEKTPPKDRPKDLGRFQPMIGGWDKLSIAMGTDRELFSRVGPGRNRFEASEQCLGVMRRYLTDIAPHASAFAELTEPPPADTVYTEWYTKLRNIEEAHDLTNPSSDDACVVGSWSPGYNSTVAQVAADLAGGSPHAANLNGLANYYQAREEANTETPPVPGDDTLVIPRLALRPLKPISAPVDPDATEAWTQVGFNDGVTLPLSQVAVEYAWFFGGVIPPFNSAGEVIGSLREGSTPGGGGPVQVEVGPDGCPREAPRNTLRDGASRIGIHKLCVDSVAQARTPEAAKAIKWALTHLGWPYSQARRNEDGYADCSSFVSRAYRDSGAIPNLYPRGSNAPVTGTFRQVPWMHKIPYSQVKPGDLVEPHPGHVAMQLADGYKVHTNQTGDVSKVDRAYGANSVYWAGWVDASKVR